MQIYRHTGNVEKDWKERRKEGGVLDGPESGLARRRGPREVAS